MPSKQKLWGAETDKAVENFPISGETVPVAVVRWLGRIKGAAAAVNAELGLLGKRTAARIERAAGEIAEGRHDGQFPIDVFQTGSGTSTHTNANEVIAKLAGAGVHPNDHVNMGQSSNDVIPAAIHVAVAEALAADLMPALHKLHQALKAKADAWDDIVKIGRTHLMDATPIRLGQEFSGYASQVAHADRRLKQKLIALRELPIGGTAVGTGINTHPDFARRVCEVLNHETGQAFHEATNHFEAQAAKDALVELSGTLKTIAVSLTKIANDIRWLGSGPRCGLGELSLPAVQPGSSIMPGKVNPVMCEAVMQVCAQVVGADAAVTYAAALLGNLDLHTGMPVIAHNLLESIRLLTGVVGVFTDKCIAGLEPNRQRCTELVEQSLAMCTSLAPLVGYDAAAAIAKEAAATGKTVRQVALEKKVLPEAQLNEALDPRAMTMPSDKVWPASA